MSDDQDQGTAMAEAMEPATLENCAREPIHIPGLIQPNGALLAFDAERRLTHVSVNARELLGSHPELGEALSDLHFADCPAVRTALLECFSEAVHDTVAPASCHVTLNGTTFDLVIHATGGRVIAEFERRDMSADDVSVYALMAHRAMLKLKRQPTEDDLLRLAVSEVRKLTGFDRVMAYRFRHDDSGDVVAEALADGLEAYLGRRYPASDIPAQARRLYVISTLRIIGNVGYQAVPVLQWPGEAPLDMSYCVLRSVSPIHVEYLENIGVSASMSVSIVANGRLWGMLACHHMSPRNVPYAIRMACDVLAQLLASAVQELSAFDAAARIATAAAMHTRLLEDVLHAGDLLDQLKPHLPTVQEVFGAHVVFAAIEGKVYATLPVAHHDGHDNDNDRISDDHALLIVAALSAGHSDSSAPASHTLMAWAASAGMPLALADTVRDRWCGVLAMRFDLPRGGWLVALRKEQIETVRWGGKPEKQTRIGPFGPRLTPRGSFAEWRETVRGTALPWSDTELHIARDLASGLVRANNARMADAERSRNQFLAILGHDLRGPLHAINMAAQMLQRGRASERMLSTIVSSSDRMSRLVTQMLDVGRLQNGLGLGLRRESTDLIALIQELIDETRVAHPDKAVSSDLPSALVAEVDRDRVLQMLGNILSNAIQHSASGETVTLDLRAEKGMAIMSIANTGTAIAADLLPALFDPFKRSSIEGREANRTGMGLGLYIANEIARGHDGHVRYEYRAPHVIFEVSLALRMA